MMPRQKPCTEVCAFALPWFNQNAVVHTAVDTNLSPTLLYHTQPPKAMKDKKDVDADAAPLVRLVNLSFASADSVSLEWQQ